MRTSFRNLALAITTTFGLAATAQIVVTVTGAVTPCMGVSFPVHIQTNTIPAIDTTVYTGANCEYSFTFFPVETQGTVAVSTSCDGGITWVNGTGSWNPFLGTMIINLACSGSACSACFYTSGTSTPWVAQFTDCSTSGCPPIQYVWTFPDGTQSSLVNPTFDFQAMGPGTYAICLQTGDPCICEPFICHSVVVDANGTISTNIAQCQACVNIVQATNGNGPIPFNFVGVNCSTGGVEPTTYTVEWSNGLSTLPGDSVYIGIPGSYTGCLVMSDAGGCSSTACDSFLVDANGFIISDTTQSCNAGFWVMQAYEDDSLNPGGVVPTPNVLWIWNLSTSANTSSQLTMSTTAGSNTATIPTGCNTVQPGTQVTGPNIPAGTTIVGVSCPMVTLSMFATATGTSIHTFSGTTGTFQFVWSWGDGTPNSTDAYPTHFYANGGPYLLCLTMTDGTGCTSTACDSISVDGNGLYTGMVLEEEANYARSGFTVNVLNQLPTGIEDRPTLEEPLLWPNPVEDIINLSFNTSLNGSLAMSIIDLNGRTVRTDNILVNGGGNRITIPVTDLVQGMYLLRFGNDQKAVSFRFVKR